jgi:hypothetical protein
MSAQSLKNHLIKYHNPNPPRKSIRHVGYIPTSQDPGNESNQILAEPPTPQTPVTSIQANSFYKHQDGSNTPTHQQQPPNANANPSQADPNQEQQSLAAVSPPKLSKSIVEQLCQITDEKEQSAQW